MKNKYLIIIILLLWTGRLAAQHNISFQVISQQEAVPFAQIALPETKTGGLCDSTGFLKLHIPSGKQVVVVSCPGYTTLRMPVDIPAGIYHYTLELAPSANTMNEIVVTGTLKEMRKSESIVPVEMYTPKYFLRNPTPSLFEAVAGVNGVRPQLQCSVCNTGDIHINGMEGPYTMILIDNMPIVSGLSTVYGLSGIPNTIVQRIEVVKGPAAAIYGSEAMGGIINVITKNPANVPKLSLDINATSYQEMNADIAGGFKLGKRAHSILSANYFHFNKRHDINQDNFTDVTLSKRASVFNKWSFSRPHNRVADFAVRYLYENRFGGEMEWTSAHRGTDIYYGESIYTRRYELIANYQLPITKEKIVFNFSATRHIQDSYYGLTPYFANQNIIFGQLVWSKKLSSRHDLLAGTGYRYTYYDDNTVVTAQANNGANAPQIKTLTGGFIQDEIAFNSAFKMIAGARYDRSNVHGHIFSPRAGAKYKISETQAIRLNAGNGFRVVNVFSEDHAALTGGRTVLFKDELQPEKSWNGNLNYTRFIPIPKGFVNLDASIFYTYYYNKIIADYVTDAEKIIFANLEGYAENYGFSLNTDWTVMQHLKATVGFTALRSHAVEHGVSQEQIQTPKFTGNYSFSYSLPKPRWRFDFNGYINSPMLLPVLPNDYRPERSPWFNISNIQATKTMKKGIEIYLGAKNLFNFIPKEDVIMRAFDPFDRQIDVNNPHGYTFDPSYNYAPVQRIRLFGGVRLSIE